MKNLYVLCLLSISITTLTMNVTIENYQKNRDSQSVETIVTENPAYLSYESQGHPAGTTQKYIESDKWVTKVLRTDDQTVGFINYRAYDANVCTFHFARWGIINLVGVKQEHQGRGYGTTLLKHAIDELQQEKVSKITLSINGNNTNAIKMYQKAGFSSPMNLEEAKHRPSIAMQYDTKIPTDYSRGNILQKHPKLSLAAVLVSALGVITYTLG